MAASPTTTAIAAAIFPVLPICTPLGALVPRKSLITLSSEQESGGKETRAEGGELPLEQRKAEMRRDDSASTLGFSGESASFSRNARLESGARFLAGQSLARRMIDHDGARLGDGAGEMRRVARHHHDVAGIGHARNAFARHFQLAADHDPHFFVVVMVLVDRRARRDLILHEAHLRRLAEMPDPARQRLAGLHRSFLNE